MVPKKRSVLLNILKKQCPRCQRSNLFTEPFQLSDPLAMPERCQICQQKFEPEPGFYYGAMFISYVFSSFIFLAIAALTILVFGLSVNQTFAIILVLGALTFLWMLRISRSLWIHFIVKFDPSFDQKIK